MSREYQRFDMAVSSVRQTLSRDHSMGLARLVAPSAAFWDEAADYWCHSRLNRFTNSKIPSQQCTPLFPLQYSRAICRAGVGWCCAFGAANCWACPSQGRISWSCFDMWLGCGTVMFLMWRHQGETYWNVVITWFEILFKSLPSFWSRVGRLEHMFIKTGWRV